MPRDGSNRCRSLGRADVSCVPAFATQTSILDATRVQVLAQCFQLVGHKKAVAIVVQGALAV